MENVNIPILSYADTSVFGGVFDEEWPGLDISPALDISYLINNFDVAVVEYELKEVVRQSLESGILFNATIIRQKIH